MGGQSAREDDGGVAACDGDEGDAELSRPFNGERGWGGNGDDGASAEDGGLLDHLERGAAGDEDEALGRGLLAAEKVADEFVERVVAADIFAHSENVTRMAAPGCAMDGAGEGAKRLPGLEGQKGLVNGFGRNSDGSFAKRLCSGQGIHRVDPAQTARSAAGKIAAAGEVLAEAIGHEINRNGDAIVDGFSCDRADFACCLHDAFGEAEAGGKILEIIGRRHHDGIGDCAVNDVYRHFDGNILRYGKSVGAVETHAFRRNRQGNREQGCCQFIPPRLEAVAQSS